MGGELLVRGVGERLLCGRLGRLEGGMCMAGGIWGLRRLLDLILRHFNEMDDYSRLLFSFSRRERVVLGGDVDE